MVVTDKTYTPPEITSLMGVIDTYMRWNQYTKRNDRSYAHYHPSEWGKCLRMQQYKHYAWIGALGEVEWNGHDSKLLRLFDKGHNMHERWSNYLDNIGGILLGRWKCKNTFCYMFDKNGKFSPSEDKVKKIYSEKKTRIYGQDSPIKKPEKCICGCSDFEYLEAHVRAPELNIKGNADLIFNFDDFDTDRFKGVNKTFNIKYLPQNGDKVVGDMKSIGSNSWKNQLLSKGAHKEYLIQLTIYVHILDCNYGLLMYENKDNSEMIWYKVPRNDEWWNVIKNQAKSMIQMASSEPKKLPPPRYSTKRNYGCINCDFKKSCHRSKIWDSSNFNKIRKNFYGCLL